MPRQKTFRDNCDFYVKRFNAHPQLLSGDADKNLGIIVVVPCLNEPNVIPSLQSLFGANRPGRCSVEVIVLINAGEHASESVLDQNKKTYNDVFEWANHHNCSWIKVYPSIVHGLSKKHAGAGWARKLAMDEAVRRFATVDNPNGIIASFDADTVCDENYFEEIENAFSDRELSGAAIHFEHEVQADCSPKHRQAIFSYELHLRLLVQGMRWAGASYAFHTVGSAMAVRVSDYIKAGGMNRRTAGEDFYFSHKIIALGHFATVAQTTVHPSARISDRVPFGTGAAMTDLLTGKLDEFYTYDIKAYDEVKVFFHSLPLSYGHADKLGYLEEHVSSDFYRFLTEAGIKQAAKDAESNSASRESYAKRLLFWFSAFRFVKYLNWSHTSMYKKQSVLPQAVALLRKKGIAPANCMDDVLSIYRELDKLPF